LRAPEASRGCQHPNLKAVPTGSDTVPSSQLSQVSVRDINRFIDESILPEEFFSVRNGRHVVAAGCVAAGCPLIAFYFESADGGDLYFPAHNGLVAGSRTPLIVAHSGESDHPFQGTTTSVARSEGRRWISLLISVFAASQSMTLFLTGTPKRSKS
jgi:hypothetical protein